MKLHTFNLLLIFSLSLLLTSCDWLNTDDAEISTNPCFVSLSFGENDSIPNIEDADFSLEWDDLLNDSVIVNLDSLPYQTRIDSVFPYFSFYSSSSAYLLLTDSLGTGLDTIYITGTDTIDFTRVISITNIAEDDTTHITYPIKVNVHKVEPELYVWQKTVDQIYSQTASMQKAVSRNGIIYFYASSGIKNYLYTKKSGEDWKEETVTGLPIYCNLQTIAEFNDKLYLIDDSTNIYSTADGLNWQKELNSDNYKFISFLYVLNGKFWAVTHSTSENIYRFAYTTTGDKWYITNEIPTNFPVGGFTSLSFLTRNNNTKGLVLGGYTASGKLLNNVWSTENGTFWVDFTVENVTLDSLTGASIIQYDDRLMLFGGIDGYGKIATTQYMESKDEGLSWSLPDTTYNQIREQIINVDTTYSYYGSRSYQSVIYLKEPTSVPGSYNHNIYLIGGRDEKAKVYSDVWVGKLNRLSFLIQ